MAQLLKRRVALAVALLAVLAGGTAVALGATGKHAPHARHAHSGRQHNGLSAAASSYLGVPASQLRSELAAGRTLGQIAAATPGKSEAGLIAALVAAAKLRLHGAEAKVPARVESIVQGRASRRAKRSASQHGGLRDAVLAYLGTDRRTLARELRSGKTLAQVADATPGRSAAGLRKTLVAALEQHLDARAAAKHAKGGAQASRLASLEKRVAKLLNRSHKGLRPQSRPAGA
jgi:hypothetical protein